MINEKNEVIDKNPTTKLKPPLLPAYDDRQVLMVNFRMLPLKQYTCNMLDGFSFWTLIKCLQVIWYAEFKFLNKPFS